MSRIYLYDVESGESQCGDRRYVQRFLADVRSGGASTCSSPGQREFTDPIYEDVGTTWVYTNTDRLYAVPLRNDVPAPLLPESE